MFLFFGPLRYCFLSSRSVARHVEVQLREWTLFKAEQLRQDYASCPIPRMNATVFDSIIQKGALIDQPDIAIIALKMVSPWHK